MSYRKEVTWDLSSYSSAHEDPKSSGYNAMEIGTELPTSCSNLTYQAVGTVCSLDSLGHCLSHLFQRNFLWLLLWSLVTYALQWTMCCRVLDRLTFNGQCVAVFWTGKCSMENVLPCSWYVNVRWTMRCRVLYRLMFNGQCVARLLIC
jgi:hypothetical protein